MLAASDYASFFVMGWAKTAGVQGHEYKHSTHPRRENIERINSEYLYQQSVLSLRGVQHACLPPLEATATCSPCGTCWSQGLSYLLCVRLVVYSTMHSIGLPKRGRETCATY